MGLIMNLINRTHDFCEIRKYAFNILSENNIITYVDLSIKSALIVLIYKI